MRIIICGGLAVLAASLMVNTPASAQYPTRPIRLLVPFAAGSTNDIVGRIIGPPLSEALGRSVVIDNRPGAGGNIGAELVAHSPPDGYTLMIGNLSLAISVTLYSKLGYDLVKDLAPVSWLASGSYLMTVNPSVPAKSVKELIALAKSKPDQIAWASTGTGSYTWLTMALLLQMTGTKMLEVNYKGGGPAIIALASGEVQAFFVGIGSLTAALPAQRVRPLGVASDKRLKQFPDIPTISESVPGYELTAWIGSFVPSATPRAIVERLNAEFRKALEHPEVSRILSAQTLDPMPMTPDEFAQRLKTDYDKYEKIIRATGARAE